MGILADVAAAALVLAGLYVLIGLAWVVVFHAAHLVNFANGELLVVGALFLTTIAASGQSYWVAIAAGLVLAALIGALIYYALLRPMTGHPLLKTFIVTFGAGTVLHGIILILWGSAPRIIDVPLPNTVFTIPGGITTTLLALIVPIVAIAVYGSLVAVQNYTSVGLGMRAAHENVLLASQRGVRVYLIFGIVFAIGAAAAAVGGILHTQRNILALSVIPLGIKGLVPALIGGFDSIKGILPGAILVAMAESFTIVYFGARFSDLTVFSLLLLVLLVKPNGLYGTEVVQRV